MIIAGIIPARYGSSRFPGKPLVSIQGHPMIEWVYKRSLGASRLHQVVVATDDHRIYDAVTAFGGTAVMTASGHGSGTERCAEAVEKLEPRPDVVINIQGDEPFVDPGQIDLLAGLFENPDVQIASLYAPLTDREQALDPNTVKVVVSRDGTALYFSRQPIPARKEAGKTSWLAHIGLYAYRADILLKLAALEPGEMEQAEKLEQLRWLEHGYRIQMARTHGDHIAIDTPADLERALRTMSAKLRLTE